MVNLVLDAVADAQSASTGSGGTGTSAYVGENAFNERYYFLVKFDVSSIPPGTIISSAVLKTNILSWDVGAAGGIWRFERITQNWTEASPLIPENAIDTTTAIERNLSPASTADLASMVQGWVDGTFPNYGVRVSLKEPDASKLASLATREHATVGIRPKLHVVYGPKYLYNNEYDPQYFTEGSQKAIDRTSNGVLWSLRPVREGTQNSLVAVYSVDNGASWSRNYSWLAFISSTSSENTPHNASMHIDKDDYMHVIYKSHLNNGQYYYMRGTPSADRRSYTWTGSTTYYHSGFDQYCKTADIVAHRDGTGWKVHIVGSWVGDVGGVYTMRVMYGNIGITSGGTITVNGSVTNIFSVGSGSAGPTYPSIDFKHTGDGKTVDGNPDLYVTYNNKAYSSGATNGINVIKGTYSGGTWTWGTPVSLSGVSLEIYDDNNIHWFRGWYFNGKVWVAGYVHNSAGTSANNTTYATPFVASVDLATNTPTVHYRPVATNTDSATNQRFIRGAAARDDFGNVYIFGRSDEGGTNARTLHYVKWNVASGTADARVVVDSSVPDTSRVNVNCSSGAYRIDSIYTKAYTNPFHEIKYESVTLNQPASTPTNVSATGSARAGKYGATISWTHNDPEGNAQTKYKFRWRPVV